MTQTTPNHQYGGHASFGAYLSREFTQKHKGPQFLARAARMLGSSQPLGSVLRDWLDANDQVHGDCADSAVYIRCHVPRYMLTAANAGRTRFRADEFRDCAFVHASADLSDLARDSVCVLVLCEQREENEWFAAVLAVGRYGDIKWTRKSDRKAALISSLVPNTPTDQLTEAQSLRLHRLRPVTPFLPSPTGQVTADELEQFMRQLVSFCIRWHCASRTKNAERAAGRDEILRQHLGSLTFRHMTAQPARIALFASDRLLAALSIISRLARSNRLRAFVQTQFVSAVEFICCDELALLDDAVQLRLAHDLFLALAQTAHNNVWPGNRDVGRLELRVSGGELSYGLFAHAAELDGLLWPVETSLRREQGVHIDRGRVYLKPAAAIALIPRVLERFYGSIVPLSGAAAARCDRVLKEAGFDPELTRFEPHIPFTGNYYRSDRPLELDDPVRGSPDARGLRLFAYNTAAVNGLSRTPAELEAGTAHQFTVSSSDGPVPVPVSALYTLMHRPSEARRHLVGENSNHALEASSLRKSGLIRSHATLAEADYAFDSDRTVARDGGFRQWLREFVPAERERRHRRHIEIGAAEPDGDPNASDGSEFTPLQDSASEALSLVSSSGSGGGCGGDGDGGDDIEDLVENVYRNRGMPLCVLRHARGNIEGSEHPKDAARMNYYPYLRSLELPGVSSRGVLVHMMRNVKEDKFEEMYRRFAQTCPDQCRKTKERSRAYFAANGADDEEADRRSSCFSRCSTKQMRGTCPFSRVTTQARRTELRRELLAAGLGLNDVEAVMGPTAAGKPGKACKAFFVATRPEFDTGAARRVAPFPPGPEVWINHPREFTYLAAMHMEASLRDPPGYEMKQTG